MLKIGSAYEDEKGEEWTVLQQSGSVRGSYLCWRFDCVYDEDDNLCGIPRFRVFDAHQRQDGVIVLI